MYEHSLNQIFHQHHTIGMTATRTTTANNNLSSVDKRSANNNNNQNFCHLPADRSNASSGSGSENHQISLCNPEENHQALVPSASANGSHADVNRTSTVNMYQRRAQFRLAMSAYRTGVPLFVVSVVSMIERHRIPWKGHSNRSRLRCGRHSTADRRCQSSHQQQGFRSPC